MLAQLKSIPFLYRLFAFNLAGRDRWVKEQASDVPEGALVLDVGAGSCPYRSFFAHCEYRTQDAAQLKGEQLRQGSYGAIDYVGDAAEIHAGDAEFDLILCTEMLEHHPEPIRVVEEFGRLLKPGGVLLLTAPLGSGIHQEPYHFYGGYTPYWYSRFLGGAGFDQISIEPNAGFFRFFGQESLRFVQLSAPWGRGDRQWLRIAFAPLWLLLAPVLALLVPLLGAALDPLDTERRFTVGYHVRARRGGGSS